jgi:cAMP phosphodiesterase
MKVQMLSGGGTNDLREHYLTSFIINDELAVDAGALPLSLTRDKQLKISNIIITHAHLDHFAGLPLMIDNIFTELDHTIRVYASEQTVESLRSHIFNNTIWPDFSSFKNSHGVNLSFETIELRTHFKIGGLRIIAIPVNHTVPSVGLIIEGEDSSILVSSDTGDTEEIWAAAREVKNLRAAFVECSYPNRLSNLGVSYGHLCPEHLVKQVRKIGRELPVYAYHIKPAHMYEVLEELQQLHPQSISAAEPNKLYEF